jgi:hypothetical protein
MTRMLTEKERKALRDLCLPGAVEVVAEKVWAEEKETSPISLLKKILWEGMLLLLLGILWGSLVFPALIPFVGLAQVFAWVLIIIGGLATIAVGVSLSEIPTSKNREKILLSSAMLTVMWKKQGLLMKQYRAIGSIALFAGLAVAGATVTAFFYLVMIGFFLFVKQAAQKAVQAYMEEIVQKAGVVIPGVVVQA